MWWSLTALTSHQLVSRSTCTRFRPFLFSHHSRLNISQPVLRFSLATQEWDTHKPSREGEKLGHSAPDHVSHAAPLRNTNFPRGRRRNGPASDRSGSKTLPRWTGVCLRCGVDEKVMPANAGQVPLSEALLLFPKKGQKSVSLPETFTPNRTTASILVVDSVLLPLNCEVDRKHLRRRAGRKRRDLLWIIFPFEPWQVQLECR
uniref:Uncharacterized protein n=1 Tax=Branchiostoma floridae TaxID=7739 RepID=C3YGS9_BRAFL|eukprot:XP_002604389.1 hypothetical protein BRAFLDRAFT_79308 [Branchiostoma floridae]